MSRQCAELIAELAKAVERELAWIRQTEGRPLSVLDVGCWDGTTTRRYAEILGGPASGVEIFPEERARAQAAGIDVAAIDLESGTFPWPDASVDVAVANQVFEHLKNVFLPMSEIARVLRPNGYLVFGVPNLASLHNRVMLGIGLQPSSIRTFGPHVRAFTYRQTRQFVELGGYYRIVRSTGVGFYPFPARFVRPLARRLVGSAHTTLVVAKKTGAPGAAPPWRGKELGEQTYYAASP